jgi:hypothetical protein
MLVRLRDLHGSLQLNGACGSVKSVKDGRFVVEISNGRCVLATSRNIVPCVGAAQHLRNVLQNSVLVKTTRNGDILAYGFWCDFQHINPPPEKLEVWQYMSTKSIAAYTSFTTCSLPIRTGWDLWFSV